MILPQLGREQLSMATTAKIVTMTQPAQVLSPELRDFLDAVFVPALVKKYFSETEKSCTSKLPVGILRTKRSLKGARSRT